MPNSSLEAFQKSMHGFEFLRNSLLGVACSGGPDSMALALLAKEWADANGHRTVAIIVDHKLRPQSSAEAKQTAAWLEARGIEHVILVWKGAKPSANIQERARIARYTLIEKYCRRHPVTALLIGHTADDQAETFLLRLARGSGVDGLSAMMPEIKLYGMTLLRPLLATRKAELLAFLKMRGQDYIIDPSNNNSHYNRVKIRTLLPLLTEVGLTPERLNATARSMQRARDYLEEQTNAFIAMHCQIFQEGYAILHHLPGSEELALRVLAEIIMVIGGHTLRPRLSDLERLYGSMLSPAFKSATLSGCIFSAFQGRFLILREMKAVAPLAALASRKITPWDNRFLITLERTPRQLYVGALTQANWLTFARTHKHCNPYPSKKILYTLPAIYDEAGTLINIPHLEFNASPDIKCVVILWQRRGYNPIVPDI